MIEFTYERTWVEIETLLEQVERRMELRKEASFDRALSTKERAHHMRNYKGLQGATYALRWVLGDRDITKHMVLGDD
jgi:hypothetical protein|tara:strand:+ start:180 stop:410 length:231 start_codon:yes stop_codon:yes gene_type:complete